ncbi:MAG: hypothetical protein ACRECY_07315, partial [Phyllobacterium sp.]
FGQVIKIICLNLIQNVIMDALTTHRYNRSRAKCGDNVVASLSPYRVLLSGAHHDASGPGEA